MILFPFVTADLAARLSAALFAIGAVAAPGPVIEEQIAIERALLALSADRALPGLFPPAVDAAIVHDACVRAALTAREAAFAEAQADFLFAVAKCTSTEGSFGHCIRELRQAFHEARALAQRQYEARRAVCRMLDEDTYDPDLQETEFSPTIDNRFFPLVPGRTLVYRTNGDPVEETRVTTLAETFVVDDIVCRAVRDTVTAGGELVEDTDDWFAQHRDGAVWYLGELARNYENGLLHDLDGSWSAGEDGAHPGIQMKANPRVGDSYRQEFLLGDAEDLATVVAVGETVRVPAGTFTGCIRTEEWSPLEPGIVETKYYAPGFGFVLGINQTSGVRTELVRVIAPR
ncbi:MAG: hypothetical protein HZB39_11875 [Planctomycetes bacterium]|nr:hypothetical protein [Planctomycetota bacterium]